MLITILILTTLIFAGLIYLISQCEQILEHTVSKEEIRFSNYEMASVHEQKKESFDDMSEAILQAFIDYKHTQKRG